MSFYYKMNRKKMLQARPKSLKVEKMTKTKNSQL